jgi:hypothetical protein
LHGTNVTAIALAYKARELSCARCGGQTQKSPPERAFDAACATGQIARILLALSPFGLGARSNDTRWFSARLLKPSD